MHLISKLGSLQLQVSCCSRFAIDSDIVGLCVASTRLYFRPLDSIMTKIVKFYFDTLSPYAWLAWQPLKALTTKHDAILEPVPVLLAGLLKANGQLGPAEIPNKRLWLIKDVMRSANAQNMKVLAPPTHPFNPLLSLRVASIATDLTVKHELVWKLFDAAWQGGRDISSPDVVAEIATSVGLDGRTCVNDAMTNQLLKDSLKVQTEQAIAAGIFGVPTVSVDGEHFWGSESDTMKHIEDKILRRDPIDMTVYERWEGISASAGRKR